VPLEQLIVDLNRDPMLSMGWGQCVPLKLMNRKDQSNVRN